MPDLPEPRRWTIHVCPFCDGAHAGDGSVPKACSYTHMGGIGMPEGAGPPEQVEVVEARHGGEPSEEAVEAATVALRKVCGWSGTSPSDIRIAKAVLAAAYAVSGKEGRR